MLEEVTGKARKGQMGKAFRPSLESEDVTHFNPVQKNLLHCKNKIRCT